MRLQDLYHRLSVGPLSNLSVGMDGAGDLTAKGKVTAKVHLNTALRSLAKRFVLREEVLIVQVQLGRLLYDLVPARAMSQSAVTPAPHYIMDTEDEPFTDTVIKVTRAYANNGFEFSLNEPDNPSSIHTPTTKQVQIPAHTGLTAVAFNYQTFLPAVAADAADDFEVLVPEVLEDPIVLFVASQIYANMNGQEHLLRSQALAAEYANELSVIQDNDLLSQSTINFQNKFAARGFC